MRRSTALLTAVTATLLAGGCARAEAGPEPANRADPGPAPTTAAPGSLSGPPSGPVPDSATAEPTAESERAPAMEQKAEPLRAPAAPPLGAGYARVLFGADTVIAEVAATQEERNRGLMYRDAVPDGTGMLFVFPRAEVQSFWMHNTYVALDIAFMGPDFRVVDIQQLEPLDTTSRPSRAPAMYALEVRQGWFEERGIGVGAQARVEFGMVSGR